MKNKPELRYPIQQEEIPSGWVLATIGDLIGKNGVFVDGDWVESKDQDPNGDIRLIQLADIGDGGYRDKSDRFLTHDKALQLGCTLLEKGDVLIARMPDPLGRACIFPGDSKKSVTVVDVAVVRSSNGDFNHHWLMYFVNAPAFRSAVASLQSGSTRKRISRKNLARIVLPVPPREQQNSIVAEIEKQFSRLDEAIENLKRVKANLKRYKASVLKAAVEGKLTEEWRKKNLPAPSSKPGKFYTYAILCDDDSIYIGHTDDIERRWKQHLEGKGSDWTKKHKPVKIVHWEEFDTRKEAAEREKWLKTGYGRKWIKREYAAGRTRQAGQVEPASKLLERILVERRKKWEEAEFAKMKAKRKVLKDDNWKKKYKEPAKPNLADLPSLPDGWIWVTYEQLGEWTGGGTPSKRRPEYWENGTIPWVSPKDMKIDKINKTIDKITLNAVKESVAKLIPSNSLLFVVRSGILRRILPIALTEVDVTVNQDLKALTPLSFLNASYLFLSAQAFSDDILHTCQKDGTTVESIEVPVLQIFPIPLPPASEQDIISQEISRRLTVVDNIGKETEQNIKRADRLRQSILKKAFSGELVPQDADDEPVEELLNRILLKQDKAGKKVAKNSE